MQACPNGAWTQVAYAFTAPTSSGKGLEITFDFGNNFSTTGKSVQITELDIRVTSAATGLISTPPAPELRPIEVELALCQRYFETNFATGVTPADNTTAASVSRIGAVWATNTMRVFQPYKVSKRAQPTITFYRSTQESTNGRWGYYTGSAWATATSTATGDNSLDGFTVDMGTSGLSVANAAMVDGYWTSAAEL